MRSVHKNSSTGRAVQQHEAAERTGRQGRSGGASHASALQLQQTIGNQGMLQMMQAVQLAGSSATELVQQGSNNTGMPDYLKSGIESLSGMSMDDVKVHYNSSQPASLNALAYAQGNQIHLGPGQEQHLPHEAWHVVQQRQGRVEPTTQAKGMPVNDDESLEQEADEMGARAMQLMAAPVQRKAEQAGGGHVSGKREMAASAGAAYQLMKAGNGGAVVQKKDEYYPSGDKEPHIHIHHGGITYTGVGHNHKTLQRGDQVRESVIMEAFRDLQHLGTQRALDIIDWLENKFDMTAPTVDEEEAPYEDDGITAEWLEDEMENHNPDGTPPAGFSFGAYTSKLK